MDASDSGSFLTWTSKNRRFN